MKARIQDGRCRGVEIEITDLKNMRRGESDHIYDGIVEHCCKSLSTNELREIVRQIEVEQLGPLSPQDIPPIYREMLKEVKDVIRKRREEPPAYTHFCCTCPHYLGSKRPRARNTDYKSSVRPYFGPEQVRYICQFKVGQAYYTVHDHHGFHRTRFVLTREPYYKDGYWWIDDGRRLTGLCLSDHSVMPYEDGQWNLWNYIIFAEPRQTSPCCPHCYQPCHYC